MKSNIKFRKIINDLKRRPEDAAKDLNVSKTKIDNILAGKESIDFDLMQKAVKIWPVNYSDFFYIEDDTSDGFKIFKNSESNTSQRTMHRNGKPYYLYKDTVMSKISPFRPEWIQQLTIVDDLNPENEKVKFNNGHFLHQFTYFIGPVNFYYMDGKKKKVAPMNTGDSMYISPYVPHTFTTRKNPENKLGHILALTYSDKVDSESLNELTAIGYDLVKKLKLNLNDEFEAFKSVLNYHMKMSSLTNENFIERENFDIEKIIRRNSLPNIEELKEISKILNINIRDLLPPIKEHSIKIKKYKDNLKWNYPSNKEKFYNFVELTNLPQLPTSKAYELNVISDKENNISFEIPSHQYIYNIGDTDCIIKINEKINKNFEPGDSIYIKPNLKHKFIKKSKLLVLRIGGKISGDILNQLSMISEDNLKRTIDDNLPWFNIN